MPKPLFAPVASAKAKRRFVLLAAAVGAVLAVSILLLPWLLRQAVGPVRLRAMVENALSEALHRKVAITGDVSVIVVPWFGLSVGPLSVADAPGFAAEPMLTADHTELTIRVLPLLGKVVSTGTVRVRGLRLHLRRDATGRTNWADLVSPPGRTTRVSAGWQVAPQPRDVRITDAAVSYTDRVTGRDWTLSDTRFVTGMGQPFNYSLSFKARGPIPKATLECRAQGSASLDQASGLPIPRNARVTALVRFDGPLVAGGAGPVTLRSHTDLTYDPDAGRLELTNLDARIPGVRLAGSARVSDLTTNPRAETKLTVTADLAGGWRDILGLAPNDAPTSLTAPPSGEEPRQETTVARNEKLSAPKAAVPGKAVLTLEAGGDASGLRVRQAELRLPRGSASATGSLTFGRTPVLDLTLTAEDLDSSELPPHTGQDVWNLSLDWLPRWRVDARLDLQRCRYHGVPITDFHATVTSGDGHARFYPVSAMLPGGLANLDVRLRDEPGGLNVSVRAGVDPLPKGTGPTPPPSRVRIEGCWRPEGAKGRFFLRSPDPAAVGQALGISGLPEAPLHFRGDFATTNGRHRILRRLALTDLTAMMAGTAFHGQMHWDAATPLRLGFDLASDRLDLDKLTDITGPAGGGSELWAQGKFRINRLGIEGLTAQNASGTLTLADGRFDAALLGGELFGGRLTGKASGDHSGRIQAAFQLAQADAAKLPGDLRLDGSLSAKASLITRTAAAGGLRSLQASVEAASPRIGRVRGAERLTLVNPKAVLTLTSHEKTRANGDDLPLEAKLTVTSAAVQSLSTLRLTASGPMLMDKTGRLREGGQGTLDASALLKSGKAARALRVSLAGPFTTDWAGGGVNAGKLRVTLGGLPASLAIRRKPGTAGPTNFSLETKPCVPRQVLTGWGLSLPRGLAADRLAKGSLRLAGTAGEAGLDITTLTLALDDTTVTGRARFPQYDVRNGTWDLRLGRLDWDAYFPPDATSTPKDQRKPFDLETLRRLAVNARIGVDWFKRGNVTFGAATFAIEARGGVFTYRQESPQFYGGRFFAEVRGDARGPELTALAELKIEGFDCARLMQDWTDGSALSSGGATFILAARAHGDSEAALRGTMTGTARLQLTRGGLKVSKKHDADAPPSPPLPFDLISSSWITRDGVARTNDLIVDSPKMQVRGKGRVDLRTETIDLSVIAKLRGGSEAAATIRGPLDNPKLTIDRGKMFGDLLYRLLQGIVSIPGKTVTNIFQLR